MSDEIIPVKLRYSDGSFVEGYFSICDDLPSRSDAVQLSLFFAGRHEEVIAPDFFDALTQLRKILESQGVWIHCNGAVENVYPSPMARSMGGGLAAYKLTFGERAKTEYLVPIFQNTLGLPPAAVQAQELFYQKWLKSLKKI